MAKQQAFTLLEFIVTVVIVAILVSLAGPSFISMIRENRLATVTNEFVAGLSLARSEAVRRAARVTLCKSADPEAADVPATPTPACTSNGGYDQGWVVFVDDNENGARDADEILIRTFQGMPDSMKATGNTNIADSISYQADGTSAQIGTFTVCLPKGHQRSIIINRTGRVSTEKATAVSSGC